MIREAFDAKVITELGRTVRILSSTRVTVEETRGLLAIHEEWLVIVTGNGDCPETVVNEITIDIQMPDPAILPELAAFVGVWAGRWGVNYQAI